MQSCLIIFALQPAFARSWFLSRRRGGIDIILVYFVSMKACQYNFAYLIEFRRLARSRPSRSVTRKEARPASNPLILPSVIIVAVIGYK
jgi:hypothetical protein